MDRIYKVERLFRELGLTLVYWLLWVVQILWVFSNLAAPFSAGFSGEAWVYAASALAGFTFLHFVFTRPIGKKLNHHKQQQTEPMTKPEEASITSTIDKVLDRFFNFLKIAAVLFIAYVTYIYWYEVDSRKKWCIKTIKGYEANKSGTTFDQVFGTTRIKLMEPDHTLDNFIPELNPAWYQSTMFRADDDGGFLCSVPAPSLSLASNIYTNDERKWVRTSVR